jgi:hypothetical protein
MLTEHRAVLLLRAFLALLFAILVVFQTLSLPGQFAYMARESADFDPLRWPLTAIAVFMVACVQVVIVATWRLLTLVQRDRIFSEAAFTWVNTIIAAIGAAWTVLLALFILVVVNADDPGAPMLLFLMLVGVTVLGLLMVVMRALLRKATALRTDLEGVI